MEANENIKAWDKKRLALECTINHMKIEAAKPLKERVQGLEEEVKANKSQIKKMKGEFKMKSDKKEAMKTLLQLTKDEGGTSY